MTILITGAAGFIGSRVAQSYALLGQSVVGIDNFNDYYSQDFKKARVQNLLTPYGVEVKELDISNGEALEQLIRKEQPTAILHFAAQAGVRLPLAQIGKYVQSNLVGFSNILEKSVMYKIPNLIYASSSSVYGNSMNLPYNENDLTIRPVSFYGATKISNELLANTIVRETSTRARGLRFFTVYGPWGRPDMAYFRLINAALNMQSFNLFGDGLATRDFTFVEDVVLTIGKLNLELQSRPPGFTDIVNIGGGNPASMQAMIDEISTQIGVPILLNKFMKHGNDVDNTDADTSYLQSLIGDQPKTQLREGLAKVIDWAVHREIKTQMPEWINSTL